MQLNPIGVAVPVFFLLMGFELWVARRRRRSVYRVNDTMADLTCGMGDQLINLVVGAFTLALYAGVEVRWGLFGFGANEPLAWALGIILVDLMYYAYHRFAHRVNFAWATHMVHHQSEEYNLAVALRQPWFAQFYAWVFYLPLAFLGLPVEIYAGSYAFNLLYQYWIHTQLIGNMGVLEWVMNTPSHHRVHHGTNPQYIDKNYAGIFIVWDRLFGTFEREDEPVVFGVMKPLRSWNPVWANVGPWVSLAKESAAQKRWSDKVWMWFAVPGWTPQGIELPSFPAPGRGYDGDAAPGLRLYMVVHLMPVIVATSLVIAFSSIWHPAWLVVGSIYIAWTGLGWARIVEAKSGAVTLEKIRLVTVGTAAIVAAASTTTPILWLPCLTMVLLSLMSWPWLHRGLATSVPRP